MIITVMSGHTHEKLHQLETHLNANTEPLNVPMPHQTRDCSSDVMEVLKAFENEFFEPTRNQNDETARYVNRISQHSIGSVIINLVEKLIPQKFCNTPLRIANWLEKDFSTRHKLSYFFKNEFKALKFNTRCVEDLAMTNYSIKHATRYIIKFFDRVEFWIHA